MVTLPGSVVARYPRFSRFNSPYPEHDTGTAIDLYPDCDDDLAPSPVAGRVVETHRVRCPPKPYAVEMDHVIVLDTGDALARILHVDPTVEAGDRVAVGDTLGHTVRSGFFAPWVANHLHVAFRAPDADPVRATGSLPLDVPLDPPVRAVDWDGTGTVVDTGDTWALLDEPRHPGPGTHAGIATDDGRVLDGGLPHYDHGGVHGDGPDTVSLLGTTVGTTAPTDATDGAPADGVHPVEWRDVTVLANGDPITGLSLFCGLDRLGAKLVHPGHDWRPGDDVRVSIEG